MPACFRILRRAQTFRNLIAKVPGKVSPGSIRSMVAVTVPSWSVDLLFLLVLVVEIHRLVRRRIKDSFWSVRRPDHHAELAEP